MLKLNVGTSSCNLSGFIITKVSLFLYLQLNWGQIAAFKNWDELSPFRNGTNCRFLEFGMNRRFTLCPVFSPLRKV